MPTTKMAAASSAEEDPLLERQQRIWKTEQALVESLVQVYTDPTTVTATPQPEEQERPSKSDSATIVEETPWCKVFKSSWLLDPNQDPGDSESTTTSSSNNHNKKYYFGGVDVGFPNPSSTAATAVDPMAVAVYVILDARTMQVIYRDHEWIPLSDLPPYISTFLAFREIGPLERLVAQQTSTQPQMTPRAILVDGNGVFHPRHAGIACFLGVRTNIPTIGIGKTLLWIENHDDGDANDAQRQQDAAPHTAMETTSNHTSSTTHEEFRWTRSKLDGYVDDVLADVHGRIFCGEEEEDSCDLELARQLGRHKGLIYFKGSPQSLPRKTTIHKQDDEEPVKDDGTTTISREQLLEALHPVCNGIAIPLEAPPSQQPDDPRFRVLGAALVGHGGNAKGRNATKGSKRPIIVSVGHKLSLAEAVSITASLSRYRIPAPVREADLYGRELLRQNQLL